MKLFIPTVGTKVILSEPFTFILRDDRRNEAFWTALHGKPVRQEYFYGYDPNSKKITSPVKTTDCPYRAEYPAKPITTVLPKDTTLVIEKISIRKGFRGDDHLVFRIPAKRTSSIPTGKFWVSLNETNDKLDAEFETIDKYANGKFIIQIVEGIEYKTPPASNVSFKKEQLFWLSDPERSYSGYVAHVERYTNTAGLDNLSIGCNGYYNRLRGYNKHFATIEELLSWAGKKNFTTTHIDAFITEYEKNKAAWEQEKQQGIVAI